MILYRSSKILKYNYKTKKYYDLNKLIRKIMSEKSNDVSSLTKLIKKILKWKGEEEAFKLVKYSIIERLLMKMLFDCKLKMIGSQDVQLLGKKNSKNEINYQESDERISSSQSKTIFGKLKEELHRIGCLDFYKKYLLY